MAGKKTLSATVYGETYTVNHYVHWQYKEEGVWCEVEDVLKRIVAHRDGTFTFVMADGKKVEQWSMLSDRGAVSDY